MRKFYYIFILVFVMGGLQQVSAQDIHFSQFYMSPLNLNPALTGVMNCTDRVSANYRNQWASVMNKPFSTFSGSYDHKFVAGRRDYFGLGGTLWSDVAGQGQFQTITLKASGAYSKYISGDRTSAHYLSVGMELGVSQRSVDFSKLTWGTQHAGDGTGDPSLPSFENFSRDNFIFPDVSVGLLWFSTLDHNKSFYIGAAASHINKPNQSFYDDNSIKLYSKYTIHAGGEFEVAPRMSLVPGVVTFFQGPSWELNAGTSARFQLGSSRYVSQSFQFGLWARLVNNYNWGFNNDPTNPVVTEDTSLGMDALILSARFDYNEFGIGFSYDINVSDLSPASNSNGAFEFSLIYTICGPERRQLYCPNF